MFAVISVSIAPYHLLWMRYYAEPYDKCAVLKDHEDAFTALYLSECFFYRILPVFVISALNVFIIVRLWKITRDRKRLLAASGQSVALTPATTTKTSSRKSLPGLGTNELKTVNNSKHGIAYTSTLASSVDLCYTLEFCARLLQR